MIIIVSVVSSLFAQSPGEAIQRQATNKKLQEKALVLSDDIASEAMHLKRAEDIVNILVYLSDILWKHDEKRARAFATEEEDREDQEGDYSHRPSSEPSVLRAAVFDLVKDRDPKLALEFQQLTSSLVSEKDERYGALGYEQSSRVSEDDTSDTNEGDGLRI